MSEEQPGTSEERPGMSEERPGYVRGAARVCQGGGPGMLGGRPGYVRAAAWVCQGGGPGISAERPGYLRQRGVPQRTASMHRGNIETALYNHTIFITHPAIPLLYTPHHGTAVGSDPASCETSR